MLFRHAPHRSDSACETAPSGLRVVSDLVAVICACELAQVDPRIRTVLFKRRGSLLLGTCVAAMSACEARSVDPRSGLSSYSDVRVEGPILAEALMFRHASRRGY